jgi:hypothetical protein
MFDVKNRFQFMPFLTAAACNGGCDEETIVFPVTSPVCGCDIAAGGLNELYFLPCSVIFTEVNLLDVDFWADLNTGNQIGRSGLILGSLAQKSVQTARLSSCRTEQTTGMFWAIKAIQKCFDNSSAHTTCAKNNELIKRFDKYLLVARMCDGDNRILPVGRFTTSAFNWTVPENVEDNQQTEIEFSWPELGMPCTMDVPGLSTVLPKLS